MECVYFNMSNNEIRAAIARACGWESIFIEDESVWGNCPADLAYKGERGMTILVYEVPKYTYDLNAMNQAENTLTVREQQKYISILRNICTVAGCWPEMATAAQRAEAFIATIKERSAT